MANNKERLLFLLRKLMDYTDEVHDYTIKQLIDLYEENGMSANVKTVRNDIDKLIEAGFKIVKTTEPGKPTYYSYYQPFNGAELKLILDALGAAKFISPEVSEELAGKLRALANKHVQDELLANTDVSGHYDSPNRNFYATIQVISQAIAEGKKISFQYYDYNLNKERILHNDGEIYTYSPYGFAWNEDRYYLLGQVDKRPDVINPFRVDLMCHISILDENALPAPPGFSPAQYSNTVFKMFGGEEKAVTLEADNSLIKKIIDRFGDRFTTTIASDKTFYAEIQAAVSPTFFAWVFQYNGKIRIAGPSDVQEQYTAMLKRTLAAYPSDFE